MIVHVWENDTDQLRQLADNLAGQNYLRVELLVAAHGPALALEDEAGKLPGMVRFLPFEAPVASFMAWNRAIREAFAELLVLLEPGDRFAPGALDALVHAAQREPEAAWIQGSVVPAECGAPRPLRGALIRKSAFRECGLFSPAPGREHQEWLDRPAAKRLTVSRIDAVTLHAPRAASSPTLSLPQRIFMRVVESRLDRQPETAE